MPRASIDWARIDEEIDNFINFEQAKFHLKRKAYRTYDSWSSTDEARITNLNKSMMDMARSSSRMSTMMNHPRLRYRSLRALFNRVQKVAAKYDLFVLPTCRDDLYASICIVQYR